LTLLLVIFITFANYFGIACRMCGNRFSLQVFPIAVYILSQPGYLMRYRYSKHIALILVLGAIVSLFFMPIKVPFSFRTTALVHPLKKWSLRADQDGNFFGELKNFKTGAIEQSTSYRFERGDIATLRVNGNVINNSKVSSGDTLGYLYSRLVEERYQRLTNQLAIEQRQMQSSLAGEKVEVIQNLQQKLVLAEQQLNLMEKNFERMQVLYSDSVITSAEYENAENQYLSAITNVNIAKSNFEIAVTGDKPENIALIQENIARYNKEIIFLEGTKQQYVLVSPINGKLILNQHLPNQVDYISIMDTSAFVIYIPIRFQYRQYLDDNMRFEFTVPGTDQPVEAAVIDISDRVELISSHQVLFVKALIVTQSPLIMPGLSVQSRFIGEPITIREYVQRTLNIFLR
jgi:hypothetical protein